MTTTEIKNSIVLTPFQKRVETVICNTAFNREEQEELFRLLFKFVDKCGAMQHWVGDAYLDSLIREGKTILTNLES